MVIRQGEVYWVEFGDPIGSAPGFRRPAVVVQSDRFNRTAIETICVVAITSNLRLGDLPGNLRLAKGEANLPKPSVINITAMMSVDRIQFQSLIGSLSKARVAELLENLSLLFMPLV